MIASSTKLSFILGRCLIQKIDHWNMENILLTALNSLSGSGASHIQHIYNGDARLQTDDYQNQNAFRYAHILNFRFIWEYLFWSWIFDRKLYHLWYDWVHYHVSFAVLQSIHKGNCIATGEACSYSWQQKDLRICFAVGCFPIYWFVVFHCLRLRFQVTRSSL